MSMEVLELDYAAESLAKMRAATNMNDYERHWLDFLAYLDRAWNKAHAIFVAEKKGGKAQALYGCVNGYRGDDPLIQYLMQARNSHEHSIRDTVEATQGYTTVTGPGKIFRGTISGSGDHQNLVVSKDLKIEFVPSRLEVVTVKDKAGNEYKPPPHHLGKAIATRLPHELAEIGLEFYRANINALLALLA